MGPRIGLDDIEKRTFLWRSSTEVEQEMRKVGAAHDNMHALFLYEHTDVPSALTQPEQNRLVRPWNSRDSETAKCRGL
jgi:hypothetical protein